MRKIVLDASTYIAAIAKEKDVFPYAIKLITDSLRNGIQLNAPTHMLFEVTSVLGRLVIEGKITQHIASGAITTLDNIVTFYHDESILQASLALSIQHSKSNGYDSMYVVLAEKLQCDFWSKDKASVKTFNRITKRPHVKWIMDYPLK